MSYEIGDKVICASGWLRVKLPPDSIGEVKKASEHEIRVYYECIKDSYPNGVFHYGWHYENILKKII